MVYYSAETISQADRLTFVSRNEEDSPPPTDSQNRKIDTLGNVIEEDEFAHQDDFIHAEYAIPSTSLYPYRGPPIGKNLEAYESQLRNGHYRQCNTTASQLILARRREMIANHVMPERGMRLLHFTDYCLA